MDYPLLTLEKQKKHSFYMAGTKQLILCKFNLMLPD